MDPIEEIKSLREHLGEQYKGLATLIEKRDSEITANKEANEATGKAIKEANDRIEQISSDIKAAVEKYETLQKDFEEAQKRLQRFTTEQNQEMKSLGQMFIESEQYKDVVKRNGVKSDPMQIEGSLFNLFGRKDLGLDVTTGGTASPGGTLVRPYRVPGIVAPIDRQLHLRDLLDVQPTDSPAIEYVEETGFTNNADVVPERGLKPSSDITFELKSVNVKTIAHWIPATRQVLADAKQLRAYVDRRMLFGLSLEEERQVLYGDGIGENIQGITTHPNVGTYTRQAGETELDTLRRGILQARLAEYPVTGMMLHPTNWANIELIKGNDDHYVWVNVSQGGQPVLWRVSVIETMGVNEDEAVMGAWSLGATLWDREQSTIRVSDSHADFFIRNQVVILAEERVALTIFRPEAFVVTDLTPVP